MSLQEASPGHAPSKPAPTPMDLALMAEVDIKKLQDRANVEVALIRQLMIGRHVQHKETRTIYFVLEVRMSLGWKAVLWGRSRAVRSRRAIGNLRDVDIIEPGADL